MTRDEFQTALAQLENALLPFKDHEIDVRVGLMSNVPFGHVPDDYRADAGVQSGLVYCEKKSENLVHNRPAYEIIIWTDAKAEIKPAEVILPPRE